MSGIREVSLSNCTKPISLFLNWFVLSMRSSCPWVKSGNFRVVYFSSHSLPPSNQRIWFVSSILREKNFLLVCKTNNGILAATFPCEDQQLPRTWSQSVLCSGCGDQHEFEEYVFWEVRLYWWQSQRWHRSPCMCTLSLSATLSVHRRKIFKSSYAELCGKGENILHEEFVEILTFGFLWNTKLVE